MGDGPKWTQWLLSAVLSVCPDAVDADPVVERFRVYSKFGLVWHCPAGEEKVDPLLSALQLQLAAVAPGSFAHSIISAQL